MLSLFHVKLRTVLLGCLAAVCAVSCEPPSDMVFAPAPFTPVQEPTGRFRITFGDGPAISRGFTGDGRLLFRTYGLPPVGPAWAIMSLLPEGGGTVREEASLYRQALRDEMGSAVMQSGRRVLAVWKPPSKGTHGCPAPAPLPPTVGVTFIELPEKDGLALRSLPSRFSDDGVVTGASTLNQTVRVYPAIQELRGKGSNPFGPVPVPGTRDILYSDGERIWRASMGDTLEPASLLTYGSFPALSRDGHTLAFARPMDLVTTSQTYYVPTSPFATCAQTQVETTAGRWEVYVYDLATGEERLLGDGTEPVFDPLASRLVARGSDLHWLDLATGESTSIPATVAAFAPAVSPDGRVLAFSLPGDADSDVYHVPIQR